MKVKDKIRLLIISIVLIAIVFFAFTFVSWKIQSSPSILSLCEDLNYPEFLSCQYNL